MEPTQESGANAILESLTAAQREAVGHVAGPLLILAGPGSGKTRVVTHRIAHLLVEGIPAAQILALTFTNKAADEMRSRLARILPQQPVWMGTFHRFCARLLRSYAPLVGLSENFSIYDVDESRAALREAIEEAGVSLTHATPDGVAHEISFAKNNLVGPEHYCSRSTSAVGGIVEQVYGLYQQRLLRANAVDFDDLLLYVATLLRDNPELRRSLDDRFRYIMVDEYQDTNFAQYAIVRSLSRDQPNLAVTGDPDQSIYGWRGANLNNILEFERDYPNVKIVRLEQNYRSTKRILHAADTLISNNIRRKHKDLFTENPEGSPVRLITYPDSRDEAEHVVMQIATAIQQGQRRARDFAIFYRVNWLSRTFEQALRAAGVPYQIVKGLEFYQRKEIKDVIAYLQLINNPRHDAAFRRVINTPPRKIGATTIERLAQYANQQRLPLLAAAREAGLIDSLPKRSAVHVAAFVALLDRLSLLAGSSLQDLMEAVLKESGYVDWLISSEDEEDNERLANIKELVTAAHDFDVQSPGENRLEVFLEQVALVSDTDDWESSSDRVSLMTLHAAKGLEFPVVFIVGAEQGVIPHQRVKDFPEQIEEERRLLFVGITRAEEELQLSYATRRQVQGNTGLRIASQFLMELPREEMLVISPRTVYPTSDEGRRRRGSDADQWPDETHDSGWEEEVYEDRTPTAEQEPSNPSAGILTAAEMLAAGTAQAERTPPEAFRLGMIVRHPEHGIGKITELSGNGIRRKVAVQFFDSAHKKIFFLAHSTLVPISSPAD